MELDYSRVRAIADEVVAERGEDYIYNPGGVSCKYVPATEEDKLRLGNGVNTETGCLVGEILKRAGADVAALDSSTEDTSIGGLIERGEVRVWQTGDSITFTYGATEFLKVVQQTQDSGMTWGEAVECGAWLPEHLGVA